MSLISVIIPVFNEDTYLSKCLRSLDSQQEVDFEVIVVDDGSYKAIDPKDCASLSKRISFFKVPHKGTAIARNFGAEKAKGDILVFVDGDMEFEPDFLKTLTQPITDGKSKGTFSTEEYVANWDNVWARCWNYENGLKSKRRIKEVRSDMIKDFRAILKTEFTRVKGFDNIGYTDTWTLSDKLGYRPTATSAKYYHYNPASINEVFWQAIWIGGRQRRFKILGKIVAAFRALAPISLFVGGLKSVFYSEPKYIQFKLAYDLGILGGVLNSMTKSLRPKPKVN